MDRPKSWVQRTWIPMLLMWVSIALTFVVVFEPFGKLHWPKFPLRSVEYEKTEQEQFMTYLTLHDCQRHIGIDQVSYLCDNGWWRQNEILNVIHKRMPDDNGPQQVK